jgi:hypothetical protein
MLLFHFPPAIIPVTLPKSYLCSCIDERYLFLVLLMHVSFRFFFILVVVHSMDINKFSFSVTCHQLLWCVVIIVII